MVQKLENEAIEGLLSKRYTSKEIVELKVNIQALIAPIIRKRFERFYELFQAGQPFRQP